MCGCLGTRASFKIILYKLQEVVTFLLMTTTEIKAALSAALSAAKQTEQTAKAAADANPANWGQENMESRAFKKAKYARQDADEAMAKFMNSLPVTPETEEQAAQAAATNIVIAERERQESLARMKAAANDNRPAISRRCKCGGTSNVRRVGLSTTCADCQD